MKKVFFLIFFVSSIGGFELYADTLEMRIAGLMTRYGDTESEGVRSLEMDYIRYDSLIRKAFESRDSTQLVVLYAQKADMEYRRNMYSAAYALYDSVFRLLSREKEISPEILAEAYLRQAEVAYYLGRYAVGVSHIYDLLRLNQSVSPILQVRAYTWLGNMFIRLGKNNLALENLEQAKNIRKSLELHDTLTDRLDFDMNIAFSSAYLQKGDYEVSLEYILKARRVERVEDLTKVYQNLSVHYLVLRDFETAKEYCEKALETAVKVYDRAVIMNNYAVILYELQEYGKALTVCLENLKETAKTDVLHVRSNLYYIFSLIYEAQDDYRTALYYRTREQEVLDSVFDQESEERILQLTNDFETEQIRRDKEILEYELKVTELKNFRKNTIIIVLILLSGTVLFSIAKVWQNFRKQRKTAQVLEQELVHMDQDNREAMQSSRREFEYTLTSKTRELTANTMYIARMCDTAGSILKDIDKLEPYCQKKETKVLWQEIRRQIASLTIEEKGWNDFKLYFEQIHPSFFVRLNEVFPHLTVGENRLCAFIVMNLNTKEISSLTNRSVRTIETNKFRLRKKMNIPKDVSILTFLRQFTS